MTTVHHPPLKGVDFHRNQSWLWIALSTVLVVLAIGAIAWAMSNASVTEATFAGSVEGTEMAAEATSFHVQMPGITSEYFGNSGELYPEIMPIGGFDIHRDATVGHIQRPGITAQYFGNSGELYPEE
jgi:hypothetical protein